MNTERVGGEYALITWVHFPRSTEELFAILEDTKDEELLLLMREVGGLSGQLAWAEWGRRKYGIAFAMHKNQAVPTPYTPSRVWS